MHLLFIPAIILLVVASLLLVPFHLSLNLRNEGFCIFGFYRLKFLGFTIRKAELLRPEKVRDKREANLRVDIGDKAVDDDDEAPEPDNIRFQKDPRMLIDTFPAFYRFLKNMIRSIHVEQLSGNISFGLNDPSDTAVISGYLWALVAMLPNRRTYIQIYPFLKEKSWMDA